jgi:hypothetical protein
MRAIGAKTRINELIFLRLGFLEAHHVRVLPAQPIEKPLIGGGTDAIGVEADDAHEKP